MPGDDRPIALVGLMGAGKSAVAVRLAALLGAGFVDLDARIEADSGKSIAELFEREGEAVFRRLESTTLEHALESGARVIACGGGVVTDPASRSRLRERCHVVWLEVTPGEAARRVAGTQVRRPLLREGDAVERLGALLEQRGALYAEVAGLRIPTTGLTPDEVAQAVLGALSGT